ncbi:uncharacterized protein BT62DRAFT_361498 [Guyanagaster necrorhizus]|uniref:Uncharacterized protein n=1 Tax=Guyanagaster necrorhizus TaxID=856835 RepID=A0A9P7VLF6_9AGAR|nr:uncharacterized protein BT62DRAFT_361498 [Guyanagaster necrorhizus MCA 3950]KAG7442869.1 hypothetical protein BT62DRAFT_361498 [Guyanagaster necrorhizus MCA 3950]
MIASGHVLSLSPPPLCINTPDTRTCNPNQQVTSVKVMNYQGVAGWVLQTEYEVLPLSCIIYDLSTLLFSSHHIGMSNYPFRHSTYYTRDEDEFISELPPMSSEEDILQELQIYHRRQASPNVYSPHVRPRRTRRAHGNRLAMAFQVRFHGRHFWSCVLSKFFR